MAAPAKKNRTWIAIAILACMGGMVLGFGLCSVSIGASQAGRQPGSFLAGLGTLLFLSSLVGFIGLIFLFLVMVVGDLFTKNRDVDK